VIVQQAGLIEFRVVLCSSGYYNITIYKNDTAKQTSMEYVGALEQTKISMFLLQCDAGDVIRFAIKPVTTPVSIRDRAENVVCSLIHALVQV
jgi:hypothetical protein